MSSNFIVHALQANAFKNLFDLNNVALEKLGVKRMIVDEFPDFPCRLKMKNKIIQQKKSIIINFIWLCV